MPVTRNVTGQHFYAVVAVVAASRSASMESLYEPRVPYETGQGSQQQPRTGGKIVPLVGAMTGLSKDVMLNIQRAALSGRAKYFLTFAAVNSFGNAGFQRQAGDDMPGTSCDFDLAEWAAQLSWHKSDLIKIRGQLCEWGILSFQATGPGEGVIRWNLDFQQWQPLQDDFRRARYTRPGAGRPKQESVGSLITAEQSSVGGLITKKNLTTYEKKSNDLQKEIKQPTHASSEPAASLAPQAPQERKKGRKEETSPNGDARGASADRVPPDVPPSKKPRKLSDEQLAKHNAKAAYISQLVTALQEAWGAPLPTPPAQRQGAAWFYDLNDGPALIDDVVDCFKTTLQERFYETQPPTTTQMQKHYSSWIRGREGYRKAMAVKRARQERADKPAARGAGTDGSVYGMITRLD